eukprot:5886399-Prorocentrum_lima.AAC.1
MTSSLVGSEMCIRDSVRGVGLRDLGSAVVSLMAVVPVLSGSLCGHNGVAVSYTHLTLPTICSV